MRPRCSAAGTAELGPEAALIRGTRVDDSQVTSGHAGLAEAALRAGRCRRRTVDKHRPGPCRVESTRAGVKANELPARRIDDALRHVAAAKGTKPGCGG